MRLLNWLLERRILASAELGRFDRVAHLWTGSLLRPSLLASHAEIGALVENFEVCSIHRLLKLLLVVELAGDDGLTDGLVRSTKRNLILRKVVPDQGTLVLLPILLILIILSILCRRLLRHGTMATTRLRRLRIVWLQILLVWVDLTLVLLFGDGFSILIAGIQDDFLIAFALAKVWRYSDLLGLLHVLGWWAQGDIGGHFDPSSRVELLSQCLVVHLQELGILHLSSLVQLFLCGLAAFGARLSLLDLAVLGRVSFVGG